MVEIKQRRATDCRRQEHYDDDDDDDDVLSSGNGVGGVGGM